MFNTLNSLMKQLKLGFMKSFKYDGQTFTRGHKVNRNDPCPCGSSKKFKKCCGR